MARVARPVVIALLVAACSATPTAPAPSSPAASTEPTTEAAPSTEPTPDPTTEVAPETPSPTPTFAAAVDPVASTTLAARMTGVSWREGCPVGLEDLRHLTLTHHTPDGDVATGELVVHADVADDVVTAFRRLFELGFPIERMELVDAYDADDQASMRANNTSGFNCRYVAGTTKLSQHGLGRAVDVNPLVNPYVKGSTVDPPEGAPYADRSKDHKGMIRAGDAVVTAFAARGWGWGGYWSSGKDYQHFSASGT